VTFPLRSASCATVGNDDERLFATNETLSFPIFGWVGHVAAAGDTDASLARLGALLGSLVRNAGEALVASPPLAAEASALVVDGAATGHVGVQRPHANEALAYCHETFRFV